MSESPINPPESVVVVGASLAGLRACETLRHHGHTGSITVLDSEKSPFYDRPPLSKQLLAGKWEPERIALRAAERIASLDLRLHFGTEARYLDLENQRLQLSNGQELAYDAVVIATGATARPLPGTPPLSGIWTLRTLEDALGLKLAIGNDGKRLVVIGAGFLGMEVAATATALGAKVTVVEPLASPLDRVLGARLGGALATIHREHGVDIRLETSVAGFSGEGKVDGVVLGDGLTIPADLVLVAIGAKPSTDWLEGSGLEIENGVVCDETLLAAPRVAAAGDLARFPHRLVGDLVRLEHWTNAAEQGAHAALTLIAGDGERPVFDSIPYFWSDQFETKIQALGLPGPTDEIEIVYGAIDEPRFVALYSRGDNLTGVVGFGVPRELMSYRPIFEKEATIHAAREHARTR